MSEFVYLVTPFLTWLVAGCLKFLINCIRAKRLAFDLIGYGGLPSNHSAIVSSMATLIALREGVGTPAFGVAITLAFIVILDASSLRRQVGKHAVAINQLSLHFKLAQEKRLRERMGHSLIEVMSGIAVGFSVAIIIFTLAEN
jgi:acid phosphatase family membrane protein YuiD